MTALIALGPLLLVGLGGFALLGLQALNAQLKQVEVSGSIQRRVQADSLAGVAILILLFGGLSCAGLFLMSDEFFRAQSLQPYLLLDRSFALVGAVLCLGGAGTVVLQERNPGSAPASLIPWTVVATASALGVVAAGSLAVLFCSIELLCFSSLMLCQSEAPTENETRSQKNAMAMILIASAALLAALTLLQKATGASEWTTIFEALAAMTPSQMAAQGALLLGATTALLVGFSILLAAAPFHLWFPDLLEHAPLAAGAFLSGVFRVALGVALLRALPMALHFPGLVSWGAGWPPAVGLLGTLSILWGSFAMLRQVAVKPMFGYACVGLTGMLFVGVANANVAATSMASLGLVAQCFALLGAFGVLAYLFPQETKLITFERLGGTARRFPVLGVCSAAIFLSLAALPVSFGFFSGLGQFAETAAAGSPGYLVIAALGLVLAAYGQLRVVMAMYWDELKEVRPLSQKGPALVLTLIGCVAVLVLGLGLMPELILGWVTQAWTPLSAG